MRLDGGTYALASLTQTLSGADLSPLIYRSTEGEWAVIDQPHVDAGGASYDIDVNGNYVEFVDLALVNSDTDRESGTAGSSFRSGGLVLVGTDSAARRLVLLDTGAGVDLRGDSGGDMQGCLVLDIGWMGTDRGHGHATYSDNPIDGSVKAIKQNIIAHPYSTGIKTSGDAAEIANFEVDDNIVVNAGVRDAGQQPGDIAGIQHYARTTASQNMKWRRNIVYQPVGRAWTSWLDQAVPHLDMLIEDGWYFGGGNGGGGIWFNDAIEWKTVTIRGTTAPLVVYADADGYLLREGVAPTTRNYDNIAFYGDGNNQFLVGGVQRTFEDFVSLTGATNCTLTAGLPPAMTRVISVDGEDGRAHVAIWNPDEDATVTVDLDAVLDVGETYYVFNALNPTAGAIASGTYSGSIQFPMTGLTNRTPAGATAIPHDPKFAVFVVRKIGPNWVAA